MKRTGRIGLLCFLSLILFFCSRLSVHAHALGLCRVQDALTHTCAQIRMVPGKGAVVSARVATARGYAGKTDICVLRQDGTAPVRYSAGGNASSLSISQQELHGCRIFVTFTAVRGTQRHSVTHQLAAPG